VGIVTAGKAHHDLMEVLRRLDSARTRWPRPACASTSWGWCPLETTRMRAFAQGLDDMLVIEEKAPVVERQMRDLLYNAARAPAIASASTTPRAAAALALGELRPSR
jgi:indolepyruvate ferredoxin oxidoreductase